MNPANPKRYPAYMDATNLSWQNNPYIGSGNGKTGRYFDDAAPLTAVNTGGADDSIIPEFVDRFPQAMPILYMRCKIGVDTIPSSATGYGHSYNSVITDDVLATALPPRAGPGDISQILCLHRQGERRRVYRRRSYSEVERLRWLESGCDGATVSPWLGHGPPDCLAEQESANGVHLPVSLRRFSVLPKPRNSQCCSPKGWLHP